MTDEKAATRERILASARREFADKGFDGARVDTIASAAGANVRMIYHHFGNKQGLYRDVLRSIFEERPLEMNEPVTSIDDALQRYSRGFAESPDRIRLMLWESLDLGPDARLDQIVLGEERARAVAERIRHVTKAVGSNPAFDDVDIELLYMALAAVAIFPNTYTTTARLITGQAPTSPEFRARFEAFLTSFAELLTRAATPSPERGPARLE